MQEEARRVLLKTVIGLSINFQYKIIHTHNTKFVKHETLEKKGRKMQICIPKPPDANIFLYFVYAYSQHILDFSVCTVLNLTFIFN